MFCRFYYYHHESHECSPCLLFIWPLIPHLPSVCSPPSVFISLIQRLSLNMFSWYLSCYGASFVSTPYLDTRNQNSDVQATESWRCPQICGQTLSLIGKAVFHEARAHECHLARLSSNNYLLQISWETFPLFVFHIAKGRTKSSVICLFPSPTKAPDIWSRLLDTFVRTFADVH